MGSSIVVIPTLIVQTRSEFGVGVIDRNFVAVTEVDTVIALRVASLSEVDVAVVLVSEREMFLDMTRNINFHFTMVRIDIVAANLWSANFFCYCVPVDADP